MADWALIFLGVSVLSAFVLRSVAQKIRTGSTGFKGISGLSGDSSEFPTLGPVLAGPTSRKAPHP